MRSTAKKQCAVQNATTPARHVNLSKPTDAHEQEAETAARQVMEGSTAPALTTATTAQVDRAAVNQASAMAAPVNRAASAISVGGQPLSATMRAYYEPRFGRDLSQVRIHPDKSEPAEISAQAYTYRNHIAFAQGAYAPSTVKGRHLIAHELAHTLQQQNSAEPLLQRACTDTGICTAPSIPGSPEDFGESEEAREAAGRARRTGMTPARARSSGHAGRAAQLETVLRTHDSSQMALLHGIFIDADLSSGTAAMVADCDQWRDDSLPAGDPDPDGMATATKPCMLVPGILNRQALQFNNGGAQVSGQPRESWQRETLLTLVHEAEHVRFDDNVEPGLPVPAGVSSPSCTKSAVDDPLSEIVAVVSEFPILFDAAQTEFDSTGPLHQRLETYFDDAASQGGENFHGALLAMGCACDCAEVDAFVFQAVDAMTSSWDAAQKTAFRSGILSRIPGPVRPFWPGAPSP